MKEILRVVWLILKVTFFGFGGGNAMNPLIKHEVVNKRHWLTNEEFKQLIITTNLIPGPSVVEALTYIAMRRLGKILGIIVAFIAIFPHLLLALGAYILVDKLVDIKYMYAINAGVMPAIIGILLAFAYDYIKSSKKNLKAPMLGLLITITMIFNLLIPAPFNIPAIVIVVVILVIFVSSWFYEHKKHKQRHK